MLGILGAVMSPICSHGLYVVGTPSSLFQPLLTEAGEPELQHHVTGGDLQTVSIQIFLHRIGRRMGEGTFFQIVGVGLEFHFKPKAMWNYRRKRTSHGWGYTRILIFDS